MFYKFKFKLNCLLKKKLQEKFHIVPDYKALKAKLVEFSFLYILLNLKYNYLHNFLTSYKQISHSMNLTITFAIHNPTKKYFEL